MIVTNERIIIGMQCMGCEKSIEETINQLDGIRYVKADFKTATLKVQFDEDKVNLESIQKLCASKGYSFELKSTFSRKQLLNYSLAFLAFTAIFAILLFARKYGYQLKIPEINSQMGDGLIFLVGFFSGLILGCGPLQVMYVMAAGNGDVLEGAKFLTLFGLGTLPALIGFGFIARLLSNAMTRRFIYASGIILIILGSMMLHKGLLRTSSSNEINTTHT